MRPGSGRCSSMARRSSNGCAKIGCCPPKSARHFFPQREKQPMKVIEKLLRERLGFEPRALGNSLLERSVRARMRAAGLADMDQYAQLLAHSAEEWNEFLEAAVVTETWFFRERETFA